MATLAIPENLKRPLAWVGYPLFALVVFIAALFATLPRDRIQERVEQALGVALGAKVTTEEFGLTLLPGPGVTTDKLRIEKKGATPQEKPTTYLFDDVTVRSKILPAIRGTLDATFSGVFAKGRVKGAVKQIPDERRLELVVTGLSLADVPNVGDLLGLTGVPMGGALDLDLDVAAPKGLFAQAEGSIKLSLSGAFLGDGKAKLTMAGNPMLAGGLTLPKVQIGTLEGAVNIEKGKATLRGVKSHSPDLDVELQGYIELRDPIGLSVLHLYLMVKPSDALVKREASLEAMVQVGGMQAKRADGYFGLSMNGSLQSPLVLPSRETPAGITPPRGAGAPKPGAAGEKGASARSPAPSTPVAPSAPLPAPPVFPPNDSPPEAPSPAPAEAAPVRVDSPPPAPPPSTIAPSPPEAQPAVGVPPIAPRLGATTARGLSHLPPLPAETASPPSE